ncbi:uncharacterized protein BDV14DRAFT_19191 [Aspergillus stella-maris]|uniref:uncharacterized protein n=1 Tax=Aspergillus stella-maris TaxID=1810926 RepID=UPI003CCE22D5
MLSLFCSFCVWKICLHRLALTSPLRQIHSKYSNSPSFTPNLPSPKTPSPTLQAKAPNKARHHRTNLKTRHWPALN